MKSHIQTLIALMGFTVASTLTVLADTSTPGAGVNQLMQNQTHWYEKAADPVGPVEGLKAKGGSLLTLKTGSYLYLVGESTLHQYQMHANALKGSAVVKGASSDLVKALKAGEVGSMTLVVPVASFKSRESGLDSNADKALKAADNPEIKFDLEKETLKAGDKDDTYVMTAKGNLTIAGTTAPVTLSADAVISGDKVEIKGVQKLKMSDYKVTPPSISLLVTSITCTDEVEIHYDVFFAP